MNSKVAIRVGALLGGLAVASGAFGAHALEERLSPDDLAIFEVGTRYQMYHALATIVAGLLGARFAGVAFVSGTVIFSGSLYALVLLDVRWLGAITPIGGVILIVGWIALAVAGLKPASRDPLSSP